MSMENDMDLVDLIQKGYRVYMLNKFNTVGINKEYLKLPKYPNLVFVIDNYKIK